MLLETFQTLERDMLSEMWKTRIWEQKTVLKMFKFCKTSKFWDHAPLLIQCKAGTAEMGVQTRKKWEDQKGD